MQPILDRLNEPSTYAGVAAIASAWGLFSNNNINTAQAVHDTAAQAAQAAAQSGDYLTPLMVFGFGLAAIFRPENKK